MRDYISFDSHKHYTLCEQENRKSRSVRQVRINHAPGTIRSYLELHAEPGTPVAVEAIGNWYWIIDEIEQAGMKPMLVHPRKAKMMMGMINKTDKLDVHGLNRLQRNESLPTVWVPPGELRDLRELTRTRMKLVAQRTRLKNLITSALAKYGMQITEVKDTYGKKGRKLLADRLDQLPPYTQTVNRMFLDQLDFLTEHIDEVEKMIRRLVKETPEMTLLKTIPGIGDILAATICLEIGDINRFASGERLASYAGTTPRVHSSGGKTRYGRLRPDINRYLRWAFVEAGNSTAVNYKRLPDRHISQLYRKLKQKRGHAKAIGAVARHLAEATYHIWTKREPYRDPALTKGRVREA